MWYVYLLRCSDGSLYCGVAKDVLKRLAQHNTGTGSKYVRSKRPAVLVWYTFRHDKSAALKREAEVKRMTRAKKLALVAGGAM